jgi:hypothetical protein
VLADRPHPESSPTFVACEPMETELLGSSPNNRGTRAARRAVGSLVESEPAYFDS